MYLADAHYASGNFGNCFRSHDGGFEVEYADPRLSVRKLY